MIKAKFDLPGIIAKRNQKIEGYVELCAKVDGSKIRIPYAIICGKEAGPTLLVDCCHHGDEYEGTEGIIKTIKALSPDDIKGTLVAVPALNLEAFNFGSRVSTIDWSYQDMNRAYPGNPEGLITQRITAFYSENFVKYADMWISFHGGGNCLYLEPLCSVVPPTDKKEDYEKVLDLGRSFGAQVIWLPGPLPFTGTAGTGAEKYGVPLLIPEIGGQGVRHLHRDENIDICANGIMNIMKKLGMIKGDVKLRNDYVEVKLKYVHADEGGFHHVLKKPLQTFKKGEVLSEITDLFGEKVSEVVAPFDGVVVGYWSYSTIHPGNWAFLLGYND